MPSGLGRIRTYDFLVAAQNAQQRGTLPISELPTQLVHRKRFELFPADWQSAVLTTNTSDADTSGL